MSFVAIFIVKVGAIAALAYIAAPYGPWPWLKNVDFEPGVFVCSAAAGAWVLVA